MTEYMIYTDGACEPNPGPGGWSVVFIENGVKKKVISGGERSTTNNRMELTAALRAMENLPTGAHAVIFTDSRYVKMGITTWLPDWVSRGWKRAGGKLANEDLWKALHRQTLRVHVSWRWVRGHAGSAMNELADREARKAIPG
ncbi:ribonuclease HI [Leptolinea tardivitalis]|uniref:Ribonuclease H n=1 Tax=Leptolinea tardivitalis TaxID=229920 RepID=A0A0P6X694_9CHLR|nr:ribonuclease HI [Leptolinea tardivitalis]KPL70470.1 ribonuclease H [Leptolinea tardivitalis]GAP22058.1 RNase HI [Leptolinea tardivitalis]